MKIGFNKPFLTGKETKYISEAVASGKISGNGMFTKKCHAFFERNYGIQKALLTTSCTDALEMAAILLNVEEGDEVIMPSYTFVSTANAFVLRGASIVFADSSQYNPNLDVSLIEELITSKTKAIVVVHYAGIACDMDPILELSRKHDLFIVEDAAQSIDSYYKGKALGSIGHLSTFSFHETKNVISGEGGLLGINDEYFNERSEIIWEKGTNRSAFFRGEIDKYGWVDIGSSFLPSEVIAAFLYAQLEQLKVIQEKRKKIWNRYQELLGPLEEKGFLNLPSIPEYATNNAHMFYILLSSIEQRNAMIEFLKNDGINAVFHYISLHGSPFYRDKHDGRDLPNADRYTNTLLRLPMYYELEISEVEFIVDSIKRFFNE
ncbi:MAG: dTDP-4-amino-4,6-dideoxygalactose transaminase [Bacteroidia bacterium]|nr:dTDP-4-amino-4,6-dideoxygalactose transaminase [Bacteroidia bacterium]NND09913.1 dTDP-4-amino-4,6-dideoxygalactose transaminase [Flavobacteriaceae bacterium]NNK27373.1 dTDP-4-amino-4,6-dideoxygalactose transaminase [Flavobacteriaceae bacterium]